MKKIWEFVKEHSVKIILGIAAFIGIYAISNKPERKTPSDIGDTMISDAGKEKDGIEKDRKDKEKKDKEITSALNTAAKEEDDRRKNNENKEGRTASDSHNDLVNNI